MITERWLEEHKPHWDRLEELTRRGQANGLRSLNHRELSELGLLYHQVAADLACLREDWSAERHAAYLNQLLGRAYSCLYTVRRSRPLHILNFYRYTFPQVFRTTLAYTATAFAVFAVAALVGAILTIRDPGFVRYLLPPHVVADIEHKKLWTGSIVTMKPLASSVIMTNNLTVTFFTFAYGILFGLGTLFLLAVNGLLLGTIATACARAGISRALWSFVLPHGVLELTAVFIAGGAGLMLARALIAPGDWSRRDALVWHGRRAVQLILGCIPMLVAAGIIEGFVSPLGWAARWKFTFAALVGLLGAGYLLGQLGSQAPNAQSQESQ